MNIKEILTRGWQNSLEVILALGKVIIPVIFLVTFLDHSGLLAAIAGFAEPFMGVFGLPGEAAMVLVIGNLTNVYGAIGSMLKMELTGDQVTILAVMVTISHSLPSETVVVAKAGAKGRWVASTRLAASFLFGYIIHLVL